MPLKHCASAIRIRRFNSEPSLYFGKGYGDTPIAISLGRERMVEVLGKRFVSPVFLSLSDDAPHKDGNGTVDATYIAQRLGCPHWLKWNDNATTKTVRRNEGIAILRFRWDPHRDLFYRPTLLDALDHYAFRPGPWEANHGFCYGLTRVCEQGDLAWDDPNVTTKQGCREVVMRNREEPFPTSNLLWEAVRFYQ